MKRPVPTYPKPRIPALEDLAVLRLASDMASRAFPAGDPRDYDRINDTLMLSLAAWVIAAVHPGDFLRGVLTNDLRLAVDHADRESMGAISAVVCWLVNNAPASCWGSEDAFTSWRSVTPVQRAQCLEHSRRWGRFFLEEA